MNAQEPIADSARAAMKILLSDNEPLEVAELVGVHNAHVYKCRANGHVSPTLKKALIKNGYIPSDKRHRGHVEYGYGDSGRHRKARVEAALAERGYANLTDYVLETLEGD